MPAQNYLTQGAAVAAAESNMAKILVEADEESQRISTQQNT